MDRISQALSKLFEKHRIVFWYDSKKELRRDFENVSLPGVENIEIRNNEFGIKYRILRELPEQKFLIYHEGPQPDDIENWLLDVHLTSGAFRTDQVAIWLSELELSLDFSFVVQDHVNFFNSGKRRTALKRLLNADDTENRLRMKILAVCASSDPRMDDILENLLAELADGRDEKIKLIERSNLALFLWEQMERCYGYKSNATSIKDFVIQLFRYCYFQNFPDSSSRSGPPLTKDAMVFLKRLKDSRQYETAFETLSAECSEILDIEQDLHERDCRMLADLDYFRLIDQKIISDLVKNVTDRTISVEECAAFIRQRRQSHWFRHFQSCYEALECGSQFIHILDSSSFAMDSMSEGIKFYCDSWYKLDQLYRKFIFHVKNAGQISLMENLSDLIESLYSNTYLTKVNTVWQGFVDASDKWDAPQITLQKHFFEKYVRPFTDKDNKVFVVISDALRYEIGDELLSLIRKEDRYDASIEPALSMLPSYTQLGMAALLPNTQIRIADDDSGTTFVDEMSSMGTANRAKILARNFSSKASTTIRSADLINLNKDDCRSLTRDHDVVYVYHNRIDATGDKRESEEMVFEAVEESLNELIKIIKKLTNANANNLIVTSDHGFIYQHRPIDESDFSGSEVSGDVVLFNDRRFVLGKGLNPQPGLRKFSSKELGLQGDLEIQIPKSINRLRLKGSGSRYVHGGASLQEVVIPVIQINKKRQSDVSQVEVEILTGSSSIISSGQVSVVFYQTQAAGDKIRPRSLRAGIFTQAGDLISDSHDLKFDILSDNSREREVLVQFVLTRKADAANGKKVILKLEENIPGTAQFKEYKSISYTLRRSFTSDFDF